MTRRSGSLRYWLGSHATSSVWTPKPPSALSSRLALLSLSTRASRLRSGTLLVKNGTFWSRNLYYFCLIRRVLIFFFFLVHFRVRSILHLIKIMLMDLFCLALVESLVFVCLLRFTDFVIVVSIFMRSFRRSNRSQNLSL